MQNAIEALLPKDEKQVRSVFVGNIPYDTTDDELKEIFGKIGPVLSFRIVHDRETQKPKGYGFCEYRDIETAHSAIRNLNGLEFRNRTLRVDSAVNDKNETNIINPVKPVETFAHAHTVQNESTSETIVRVISSLNPEQIVELLRQMQCCIKNDPEESREMLAKNPQLCFALLHACLVMKLVDEKDLDALIVKNEQNLNAHVQNYQTFNNVGNSVSNYGEMYAQTRNIDSAQTAEKMPQNFNPQINKGNLGNMLNPNIPPNINLPPNLKIQQNVGVPQNLSNVQNLNIPPNLVQNVSNQQHFSFDPNFYAGKPNIVDYAGKSTLAVPGNVPVNLSENVSSSISITSPTSLGPAVSSIPVLAPGTPSHSKVTPHPTSHGAPHSSSHQQQISGQLSSGISGQIPGQMASQIGVQHQGQIQIGGQSGFPPGIPPGGLQSGGLSSGVQSVSASGVQTGLSPSAHLRSQGLPHSGTHLPSHQGSHGISHQTPHQQPHGGPHSGASLQGSHPSARSQDPTQATGNYRQAYQDFRKQKSREYSDFYEDYPRDFESGGAPPATPRSLQFEDYQTDRNSSREDMDFDQYRGQHQEQTYNRFQQEGRGGNRRDARPQYQNEQRYYSSREQRGGKMVQKSDNRGQHTRNQSYHDEYSNERWDRDFQQSSHQGSGEQSRGRQSRY